MPERVFYFTDGATYGGAEQVLLALLAGLDRARWQPLLIHHREPGLAPLFERARGLGVPLHELPRTQGQPTASRWAHLAGLVRYLRAERPDVFHAQLVWPLACKYGLLAAALARVPAIVATEHCHFSIPWRNGIYLQQAVSLGVHRYIGVSQAVAEGLRRSLHLPARKVDVVHNGIAANAFGRHAPAGLRAALTGGSEAPIVMCVARLDAAKGHRFLLRAAAEIPEAMFVMVGEGSELGQLQAEARTLGVESRVRFLGHRHDVADLLACCNVFVLPSLNEGLPLSVLEAMAAGRPVVATDVGGTYEAVTHNQSGLLVPPADADALASAIRSILSRPDLAQRLASGGRARVREKFTAEAMVAGNTRIYRRLLDGRRGQRGRG